MFDEPQKQEDLFAAFAQSTGALPGAFQMPMPGADGLPHPTLWPPFQMPTVLLFAVSLRCILRTPLFPACGDVSSKKILCVGTICHLCCGQ